MPKNLYADTIEDRIRNLQIFDTLKSLIRKENNIYVSQLFGASKSFFIKELNRTENNIVVLLPDVQSVAEMNVELDVLGISKQIIALTEYRADSLQEKLTEIAGKDKFVFLSSYEILKCLLPTRERIEHNTTKIQIGGNLKYEDLLEYLNLLNYTRDKFVEAPGYYSQRGSIIDFWSFSEKNPVRLEFDGDFLESIRYFDQESQRSIEKTDVISLAASMGGEEQTSVKGITDIFSYLDHPVIVASSYELKNLETNKINLFIDDRGGNGVPEDRLIEENKDLPDVPELESQAEKDQVEDIVQKGFDYLSVPDSRWIIEEEISTGNNRLDLGITEPPTVNSNYEVLFNVLKEYAEKKFDVFITSENELQSTRLRDLLSEYKEELSTLIESGDVKIETLPIKKGFVNKKAKLIIISDYQIFNKPYRTKVIVNKKYKKSKSRSFASIKKGDYVVHEDYGIGKYVGLENIKIGEVDQESMKIIYNEGGVVYVNLNYLTLVKKYSSNENLVPSLSTLGTSEWNNTKHKAKRKIKEAAKELIELYAKRKATQGFRFSTDTIWQKELEASFFYEDTPDQDKVTKEVKTDMEAENPMDRLVCGDVGFGKTEVAIRAAFKAVQDGKQVAVLVPTTILAEQHYNTFKDRLTQFPVKVAALSRFQSKKQQTEILGNLNSGQVDVVIGTHRLISKDIIFKDL